MSRALHQPVLSAWRNINRSSQTQTPPPSSYPFSTTATLSKKKDQSNPPPEEAAEKPKKFGNLQLPHRNDLPTRDLTYATFAEWIFSLNPDRNLARGDVDAALNHWIRSTSFTRKGVVSTDVQMKLLVEAERYWEWREKWFGSGSGSKS